MQGLRRFSKFIIRYGCISSGYGRGQTGTRQRIGFWSSLAGKLGSPKAQVVAKALWKLERDMFWREVHDSYMTG